MPDTVTPLAKGTTLVDLVKAIRKERQAFEGVLPPDTREFVDSTRVLVGSWYPEAHFRNLLVALDRVYGKGDMQLCRQFGRFAAQKDLTGVYHTILVAGDPLATLKLSPTVWPLYHNTGVVKVEPESANAARMRLEGFADPSRAGCGVFAGWLEAAARMAGARSVEVDEEACRARGEGECVFRMAWSI